MMETYNGLTDLHSLIATIAQTAVDRDKLQKAIFSLQASEVYDTNFSVVTNSVRHFAQHTFLLALEELSTPFITIMVILIQILTTWTLVFTLKCVKKYFPKFLAYSRDIFTVCFSTFLSTSKSITISNTDESSNHKDTSISEHIRLQPLENSGSRECFSRTNTMQCAFFFVCVCLVLSYCRFFYSCYINACLNSIFQSVLLYLYQTITQIVVAYVCFAVLSRHHLAQHRHLMTITSQLQTNIRIAPNFIYKRCHCNDIQENNQIGINYYMYIEDPSEDIKQFLFLDEGLLTPTSNNLIVIIFLTVE